MSQKVTDASFAKEVLEAKGYVLVDFWAEWCGPCRQLAPLIDELAKEMEGELNVLEMDVDANPDTPSKFGIRGIPTMILFHDGKQVASKTGSMPKSALVDWVKSEMA